MISLPAAGGQDGRQGPCPAPRAGVGWGVAEILLHRTDAAFGEFPPRGKGGGPSRDRRDQLDGREIGAVARGIARDQGHACDRRMGADEEVRQDAGFGAAATTVSTEYLGCEKKSRPRYFGHHEADRVDCRIQLVDSCESWCGFGINDGVNRQAITRRCGVELLLRPIDPTWIVGDHVQQNAGINEDHGPNRRRGAAA